MAAGIRLISTDFDGTLIGHPSDGRCVPALARALKDFKASGGLWAVNTGRSLTHALEGVEIFQAPVEPDFFLTHEREIYRRDSHGVWQDFGAWNQISRQRHAELFDRSGPVFAQLQQLLSGLRDVTLIDEDGHVAGLIASDENVMARIAAQLDPLCWTIPNLGYQRNTIYLRFCHRDYHKGSSLGELSRLLQIDANEIFAAGDHFNDLSMLDPKYAAALACPANAIAEVKAAVAAAQGWVARENFGEGVASALDEAIKNRRPREAAAGEITWK